MSGATPMALIVLVIMMWLEIDDATIEEGTNTSDNARNPLEINDLIKTLAPNSRYNMHYLQR